MPNQVSQEPSWAYARGVPFECVACLDPGASGATHGKLDLQFHARNVTILRPGRTQAPPEDVYPFSFCYDTASTTEAIYTRTVRPYVHRVLDGFNVNCIFLGSTSSRKDVLFQGHGTSTHHAGDSSQGIVHHALTALFDTLHKRSIEMGQAVAASLRAVPSKSFDYVVETSYVHARDELVHDVYSSGNSVALVGDPLDGWALQGAQKKSAINAAEAQQHFEAGRALCYNPAATGDNIDAHTLLAFIVTVWQFWPAVNGKEEAEVVRAQLRFVHSPGTERWAVDPGLLRIREGTSLNHSLLAFSASIQELRSVGSSAHVDTGKSVLSKLLAHSFGGNVYTLVIGAFVHGEALESEALLKHMQGATLVETFPVKNGICARGLLRSLQSLVFQLQAEQRALEEQLEGGNSHNVAFSTGKMAQIMEQNLELKEEMAAVLQEKAKVQEALDSMQNSASVSQEEMKRLMDAVVSSEENRLAMGRALIDAQLEHNTAAQEAEQQQYVLEQQILELEGRLAQASAMQDGQVASDRLRRQAEQQRDVLDNRFRFAQTHTEELLKTIASLEDAKHKIEQQSQEETLQLRQRLLEQTQSFKKLETDLHTTRSELQLLQHRQGHCEQEKQDLENRISTLQGLVHSDKQPTEKQFIMNQDNEVRDLRRQKQALEESVIALKQSTSSHNNKLNVMRQDYQQKLNSLVQQMLNMRAQCQENTSDTWDTRAQRTLAEVTRVQQEQERENMSRIERLRKRLDQMTGHFRTLLSEYRSFRNSIECSGQQCPVRKARHEDELLGTSVERLLLDEDVEIEHTMGAQPDLHLDLPVVPRAGIDAFLPRQAQGAADVQKMGQLLASSDLQLVRKVKNAETRALLAEEQLQQMTQYMASATQAYQQEIMRLRKLVSQDNKHRAPA